MHDTGVVFVRILVPTRINRRYPRKRTGASRFDSDAPLALKSSIPATPSPFDLTLSYVPIYRTSIRFSSEGKLRRRDTVEGRVARKSDATNVVVRSSGKGRASRVRYSRGSGKFSFSHTRVGKRPRRGRMRVRYTVYAFHGGQRAGVTAKVFTMR